MKSRSDDFDERPIGFGRILVVDDEPSIRELLTSWLASGGFDCDAAANAEEAWELLNAQAYSLLVSDIQMPGQSGLELLARARKRFPAIPVIMATAQRDRQTTERTRRLGASDCLIKPFGRQEFLQHTSAALRQSSPAG